MEQMEQKNEYRGRRDGGESVASHRALADRLGTADVYIGTLHGGLPVPLESLTTEQAGSLLDPLSLPVYQSGGSDREDSGGHAV